MVVSLVGKKSANLVYVQLQIATNLNGLNGGINGGRTCWAIEKTLCGNTIQGTFTRKLSSCIQCEFYSAVRAEEKENYIGTLRILSLLNEQPRHIRKEPRYARQEPTILVSLM